MAILLTLDASVFVAACRNAEPGHGSSRALLRALQEAEIPLIEPALLPVEIAAALSRVDGDAVLAREFAESILSLPLLTVLAVDERFARRALAVAVEHGLRGADAIYVTAAAQFGARLVTLDREQLKRSPGAVGACTPEAVLKILRR